MRSPRTGKAWKRRVGGGAPADLGCGLDASETADRWRADPPQLGVGARPCAAARGIAIVRGHCVPHPNVRR